MVSKYCKDSIGVKNGINQIGGTYDKKTPLIRLVTSRRCNDNIIEAFLKLPNINIDATYQEASYDDNNNKVMGKPMTAMQLCEQQGKQNWAKMIKEYKK